MTGDRSKVRCYKEQYCIGTWNVRSMNQGKLELPYNPAIPLPDIHPEKTIIQKNTCILMFTEALFTKAKTWKEPKCSSTGEWMKTRWYISLFSYSVTSDSLQPHGLQHTRLSCIYNGILSGSVVAQSCLTLCDPMDCSPSGSSVHGILQARILEWVAISFSRGSFQPRDWTWVSASPALQADSLPAEPSGKTEVV